MSFWNRRSVLVTGASGLLGSGITAGLLERGASVVCLIRDQVPGSRFVLSGLDRQVTVVRGELEDHFSLLRALNEYEIDSVFHLGAQTIVGTAVRSPLSTFESNIRGTWNLLEACRTCASLVERILVASSDKAYGVHDKLPYTEDTPLAGRAPYDVSKSCTDLIALSYFNTYRLPVAVTRCGNLYGAGDLNFNRLIPGTIRSALHDEAPVIRSNGKFLRDYFYVEDAVNAYLTLAEALNPDSLGGEAFNFGNECAVPVLAVVERILALTGKASLEPVIRDEARNEIPNQYLNCAKARRMLGWRPLYDLDGGLEQTIGWYRGYFGLQAAGGARA